MPRARRWLRTFASLTPPVVVSITLAVCGLLLVRAEIPFESLRDSNNEVGNYLQTLGTIYAVLLAFVVVIVWGQFNDVRTLAEREANELLDLYRSARAFPPGDRGPILDELRAYADDVVTREWPAMRRLDERVLDECGRRLDAVWERIVALEPETDCHRSLFDEMLSRFNDLSDCRTGRISASRMRIPAALKILIYAGAVFTVASLYLFAVRSALIHALMTGALAGAVSHVLYVIRDLDDPFRGDWQVSPDAFERVRRTMEAA